MWTLNWPYGTASIQALGGMLGPVDFKLAGGQQFQPFYVAPWVGEPIDPDLPGLLHSMRGEWPCVPFSRDTAPSETPPHWQAFARTDPAFAQPHGPGANQPWQLLQQREHELLIGIDYPAKSAVARLERRLVANPDAPEIDITLRIYPRADAIWPVALHPTLRLPQRPGSVRLRPGAFSQAVTYPLAFEASSQLRLNATATDLAHMPGLDQTLDLSHLPLANASEELVQLMDCDGGFSLDYLDENARVTLTWDASLLPDVVLWISNGGRPHAPWLGRNFALGVEPLNGTFELGGVLQAPPTHPLAQRQGLVLRADTPVDVHYRISAGLIAQS